MQVIYTFGYCKKTEGQATLSEIFTKNDFGL